MSVRMKVTIRTISGPSFQVEAAETETVRHVRVLSELLQQRDVGWRVKGQSGVQQSRRHCICERDTLADSQREGVRLQTLMCGDMDVLDSKR